jgi:hypothetical protein
VQRHIQAEEGDLRATGGRKPAKRSDALRWVQKELEGLMMEEMRMRKWDAQRRTKERVRKAQRRTKAILRKFSVSFFEVWRLPWPIAVQITSTEVPKEIRNEEHDECDEVTLTVEKKECHHHGEL